MRPCHRLRFLCALILSVVAALSVQSQAEGTLVIYAATSLTDAFEQLTADFSAQHPQAEILLNLASSSTLAAQLLAGAPADVFASANEAQMGLVVAEGRIIADEVEEFAGNQLVLILPADNPAEIGSIADLAGNPLLLVLAVSGTPIREYTNAMLQSYNDDLGDEFSEGVLDNLVSEESNVRQVVARVALGEADAGIVYQSDVIGEISDQLITVPIDPRHNQRASYPIAALADSQQKEFAERFIDFVQSDGGQLILRDYGFCSPDALEDEPLPDTTPEASASAATDQEEAPCDGQET